MTRTIDAFVQRVVTAEVEKVMDDDVPRDQLTSRLEDEAWKLLEGRDLSTLLTVIDQYEWDEETNEIHDVFADRLMYVTDHDPDNDMDYVLRSAATHCLTVRAEEAVLQLRGDGE